MRSSNSKGVGVIELVIVLLCLGLLSALIYYKGFYYRNDGFHAKTVLAHLKVMANLIEKQSRELGAYPLSLQAMIDKNEYLRPEGNSKGYTTEAELRQPWNGPYLTNYRVYKYLNGFDYYRYFKISLANIHRNLEGNLRKTYQNEKILVYAVTSEDAYDARDRIHAFAEKLIKQCNGSERLPPARRSSVSFAYHHGNHLAPCGFFTADGSITDITYFITELE